MGFPGFFPGVFSYEKRRPTDSPAGSMQSTVWGPQDVELGMFILVLLKEIFYFWPFLRAFWGIFFIFSRVFKQIQVILGQESLAEI